MSNAGCPRINIGAKPPTERQVREAKAQEDLALVVTALAKLKAKDPRALTQPLPLERIAVYCPLSTARLGQLAQSHPGPFCEAAHAQSLTYHPGVHHQRPEGPKQPMRKPWIEFHR